MTKPNTPKTDPEQAGELFDGLSYLKDNFVRLMLQEISSSRFLKYVLLLAALLLSAGMMPAEISASGINIFRFLLSILVIFFIPGLLLLPLIAKRFEPDFLDAIILSFAISIAFIALPLMIGFSFGLSFQTVLALLLSSLMGLLMTVYILDLSGIISPQIILSPFNSQNLSLAFFMTIVAVVVFRLGAIVMQVSNNIVHLGRIRRILDVDQLSSVSIEPFKEAGAHSEVPYPLWQLVQASISKLSGVDPILVWYYLSPLLTVISMLALYLLVRVLFNNRVLATFVVVFYVLANFFIGDHIFKLLPGLNYGGEFIFESFRLLSHPIYFSMMILLFLISSFFIVFLQEKKFALLDLLVFSALCWVLALIYLPHLIYLLIITGAFLLISIVLRHERKGVIFRVFITLGVILIFTFFYYDGIAKEVASHASDPSLSADRYLEEGRIMVFGSGYLPTAKDFVGTIPLLLVSLIFIPLVRRHLGMTFLFANVLSVLYIAINPWAYTRLAQLVTFTQMDRFIGNVWLNWLLSGIFVYFLLALYTHVVDSAPIEKGPFYRIILLYIAWLLITGYYVVSWLVISGISSLSESTSVIVATIILTIVFISLIVLSYIFSGRGKTVETILKKRPDFSLVVLFLIGFLVFSYSTSDINSMRNELGMGPKMPTDPLAIDGNDQYVSHGLSRAVMQYVKKDDVIIADPYTAQAMSTFVPRYFANYSDNHGNIIPAKDDIRSSMITVIEFLKPATSIDKRQWIADKLGAKYVIVNESIFRTNGYLAKQLLPDMELLFDDEGFKLYRIYDDQGVTL